MAQGTRLMACSSKSENDARGKAEIVLVGWSAQEGEAGHKIIRLEQANRHVFDGLQIDSSAQ
jgi:hypothetical protein